MPIFASHYKLIFSVTTHYGCIGYDFAKIIGRAKEIAKIYASVSHDIKPRIITKLSLLSAKVISRKEKSSKST